MSRAEKVMEVLTGLRCYRKESELQRAIEQRLKSAQMEHDREVDLGDDFGRIDFMVERTGLEVKTEGSPSAVAAQIIRYCKCAALDDIIIVTTKARLGRHLPQNILGKRVHVLALWKGML